MTYLTDPSWPLPDSLDPPWPTQVGRGEDLASRYARKGANSLGRSSSSNPLGSSSPGRSSPPDLLAEVGEVTREREEGESGDRGGCVK